CAASSACWGTNPQDTLSPRGPVAHDEKALFYPIFWIAVVVFFLVEGLLVYCLIRFRHKPGTDVLPKQVHGNTRLEIGWTIAPTLLLAIISIPTVATIYNLAPKNTADSINVTVVGHQWWWEFQYPDLGVVTANELHIPTGRRINLTLHSIDVIHAFHVPELAGQLDVVPGHSNEMWIQSDKPGTFYGQCTQFCGASHAFMRFRVMADAQPDFDTWVAAQKAPPIAPTGAATKGSQLFANGACIGCHTIQGVSQGKVGPNLTHFGSRTTLAGASLDNTPANVQKWIHNPQAVKPQAKMPNLHLSDQDVADLVKYLETLK
ncbi:MAG: cytochrome c oxidase subunit II, partial [Dehalococcoidia bacterium]